MSDSNKTDEEVLQSHDDLEMILRPHLWPTKHYLPVVRRAGRRVEIGVIINYGRNYFFVANANIYQIKSVSMGEAKPVDEFYLGELVKMGWEVD